MVKKKRYYKINERVYVLELKKVGVIKALDVTTRKAKVEVDGEVKEFELHQINKLRKHPVTRRRITKKQKPLEIEIKMLEKDLPLPERHGDWIDLRAAETVELKKGEFKTIRLGVAMKLPKGYEAYIVPRSSTFGKYYVIQTNHFGVVDNTYCGDEDEWKLAVYAMEDTKIEKGDRICQFRIQKSMPKVVFKQVETLNNPNRGGFGSTGHK